MGLWPEAPSRPPPVMLTPVCRASHGVSLAGGNAPAPVSTVIGTGNVALVYEVTLDDAVVLFKAFASNGATVNGSFDIGLYGSDWRLIVSTGSTAQVGASILQEVNITDVVVGPGVYYLAFAFSSATAAYICTSFTGPAGGVGGNLMLTAFPLPATFVSGGFTTVVPRFGFSTRTLAA
jgi:hypothetical protein